MRRVMISRAAQSFRLCSSSKTRERGRSPWRTYEWSDQLSLSLRSAHDHPFQKKSLISNNQQLLILKDKCSIILIALLLATCAYCWFINKSLTSYARAEQLSNHHHCLLINYTKLWLSLLDKLDLIIIIFFFVRQNQLRGRHMTRSDSGTSSSWRDHGPHNSCWLHRRQSQAHHRTSQLTARFSWQQRYHSLTSRTHQQLAWHTRSQHETSGQQ